MPFPFSTSVVLVVGVNDYEGDLPNLANAENDACSIEAALVSRFGFTSDGPLIGKEATKEALFERLKSACKALKGRSGSRFLLYIAAHGNARARDRSGFLLLAGSKSGDEASWLSYDILLDCLNAFECRHMLVVLDACHSGSIHWSAYRQGDYPQAKLNQADVQNFCRFPAWQVLCSTGVRELAADSSQRWGNNSPFAELLLQVFDPAVPLPGNPADLNGDGLVTATELYLFLRQKMAGTDRGFLLKQTPCMVLLEKHDFGEFVFPTRNWDELTMALPPVMGLDELKRKNPYRGLKPYGSANKASFFGRDRESAHVAHMVQGPRCLSISGASFEECSRWVAKAVNESHPEDEALCPSWAQFFSRLSILDATTISGQLAEKTHEWSAKRLSASQAVGELLLILGTEDRVVAGNGCAGEHIPNHVLIVDLSMADEQVPTDDVLLFLGFLAEAGPDWLSLVLVLPSHESRRTEALAQWAEPYRLPTMGNHDEVAIPKELRRRLRAPRFIAVLGASGSGKSSLVMAGVLPRLKGRHILSRQGLGDDGAERFFKPGGRPVDELVSLLADNLRRSGQTSPEPSAHREWMGDEWKGDGKELLRKWLEDWRAANPEGHLLLLIDQLEELVSLSEPKQRATFEAGIAWMAEHGPPWMTILATLRSDFEPSFRELLDLARGYRLTAMLPAQLREAITEPARTVSVRFDRRLVDRMIDEVSGRPGALPLLSLTLSEVFGRFCDAPGDDRILDESHYKGGVRDAVTRAADKVFKDLEARHGDLTAEFCKLLMVRLVTSEGGVRTRRRAFRSELCYDNARQKGVDEVLEALVEERLIVRDQAPCDLQGGDLAPTVEPAHDALVAPGAWPKLTEWLEGHSLSQQAILVAEAQEWNTRGKGRLGLPRRSFREVRAFSQGRARALFWVNKVEDEYLRVNLLRWRGSIALGLLLFAIITFLWGDATFRQAQMADSALMEESKAEVADRYRRKAEASAEETRHSDAETLYQFASLDTGRALTSRSLLKLSRAFRLDHRRNDIPFAAAFFPIRVLRCETPWIKKSVFKRGENDRAKVIVDQEALTFVRKPRSVDGTKVTDWESSNRFVRYRTLTNQLFVGSPEAKKPWDVPLTETPSGATLSADRRWLVTLSLSGTLRLWDCDAKQQVGPEWEMFNMRELESIGFLQDRKGLKDGVYHLALVTRGDEGETGRILEIDTSQIVGSVMSGTERVDTLISVAWRGDGKQIVGQYQGAERAPGIRIWNWPMSTAVDDVATGGNGSGWCAVFSPYGRKVYAGTEKGILVVDPEDKGKGRRLPLPGTKDCRWIECHPGKQSVLALSNVTDASKSQNCKLMRLQADPTTGELMKTGSDILSEAFLHGVYGWSFQVNQGRVILGLANKSNASPPLICDLGPDPKEEAADNLIRSGDNRTVALNESGDIAAVGTQQGDVEFLRRDARAIAAPRWLHMGTWYGPDRQKVNQVIFGRDPGLPYVAVAAGAKVWLVSPNGRTLAPALHHPFRADLTTKHRKVWAADFCPTDSSVLATGAGDGRARIWRLPSWQLPSVRAQVEEWLRGLLAGSWQLPSVDLNRASNILEKRVQMNTGARLDGDGFRMLTPDDFRQIHQELGVAQRSVVGLSAGR